MTSIRPRPAPRAVTDSATLEEVIRYGLYGEYTDQVVHTVANHTLDVLKTIIEVATTDNGKNTIIHKGELLKEIRKRIGDMQMLADSTSRKG